MTAPSCAFQLATGACCSAAPLPPAGPPHCRPTIPGCTNKSGPLREHDPAGGRLGAAGVRFLTLCPTHVRSGAGPSDSCPSDFPHIRVVHGAGRGATCRPWRAPTLRWCRPRRRTAIDPARPAPCCPEEAAPSPRPCGPPPAWRTPAPPPAPPSRHAPAARRLLIR